MKALSLLALLALLQSTCVGINVVPATISDRFGNTADVDSNLEFAPMPAGDAYVVDPQAYSYNGLLPLFEGVHGFVKISFGGEIPYDLFLGLVDGSTALGTDLIMPIASWGYGYVACFAIGFLFLIIFPIVGCCFCCCRTCCSNCGGKMVQNRSGSTSAWRCCYIITLFLSCAFLGSGMICSYVVNERMTTTFTEVSKTVGENVDDFSRYANNTLNQVNYVALNGFNFTAKVMLRDLDNIGPIVGGAVQESFDRTANVGESFDEMLKLDPLLKSMIDGLTAVKKTKTAVITSVNTLEAAMTAVGNDIDATFTTCNANPGNPCGTPPATTALKSGSAFDPNAMPSFDSQLTDLEKVYAENITGLVTKGKQQFANISGRVEQESAPVITTIRNMVSSFDGVISKALASVNDLLKLFDTVDDLTKTIRDLKSTAVAGSLTVGTLENYRWMGGLGLTCFVLLIFFLQFAGLVLGCAACCCCGDKNQLPTERGALGNCAGYLLMASVGLVFIFGALIMLLVWLPYVIGAPLELLVCSNLRDTDYKIFKKLIDGGDPATGPHSTVMGKQEGYTLGKMVFGNSSVPLTVSGVLTDCKNNEPAWKALYIGKFFDLDQVLDYKSTINVDSEINKISVDLSTLEILSNDTRVQLKDMGSALQGINFTGLVNTLGGATVTADFSVLTSSLQAAASAISSNGALTAVHTKLQDHITELNRIETTEYVAVNSAQTNMLTSVVSLNATASSVPKQIDTLITKVGGTQADLQANGENIIKNESKAFANRVLRIADQFASFVNKSIQEELGRCKPVYNFYQSVLVNTLCGSVVDSLNGVWFTLGWCLAFMVFGMILSTKLAKHVRRMRELHPDDQFTIGGDNREYGPGKGKVHPI